MTTSSGAKPRAKSSKVQVIVERPEKSRKWLWITIAILGFLLIGAYGNRSQASTPTPAVAAAQSATQSQQQGIPVVLAYTNGDYEVGNGAGQIAPGRYLCDGDDSAFAFSTWTTYSDSGKQHILGLGSVSEQGRRYLTVTPDTKMVSFTGDAMWIKG